MYWCVPDVRSDPRYDPDVDVVIGGLTRTCLCVPLKSKTGILGVIQLIDKATGIFSEDDAAVAKLIGAQVESLFHESRAIY